jgi:peptidyl-tRNA hydrolase
VLHRPSVADRELIEAANQQTLEVMPLIFEGRIDKAMQALHTPSGQ